MTIEELIQRLEELRDEHGPHIEVAKRCINGSDGSTWLMPVKKVRIEVQVEDEDDDPSNWFISL